VFAVADDDQIIYRWAGASYRQIEKIRTDFGPKLIQLVENHRCPPEIVGAAKLLVAHNTSRTPGKRPLVAAKKATAESVSLRLFDTDTAESEGLSAEIAHSDSATWGETAVLGRTPLSACSHSAGADLPGGQSSYRSAPRSLYLTSIHLAAGVP
jgi:DNA helicase-2/ATP-dependent DNA helicase PcrA